MAKLYRIDEHARKIAQAAIAANRTSGAAPGVVLGSVALRSEFRTTLDPTYQPVEKRISPTTGRAPEELPKPELDSLESALGSLTVAATSVLAGTGVFGTAPQHRVTLSQFEREAEPWDGRMLQLLLNNTLSQDQKERFEKARSILSLITIVARACHHVNDAVEAAHSTDEKRWIEHGLAPATHAVIELGVHVAGALNHPGGIDTSSAAGYIRRADHALNLAIDQMRPIPNGATRRAFRAAIWTMQVIRDCLGTIAAMCLLG